MSKHGGEAPPACNGGSWLGLQGFHKNRKIPSIQDCANSTLPEAKHQALATVIKLDAL